MAHVIAIIHTARSVTVQLIMPLDIQSLSASNNFILTVDSAARCYHRLIVTRDRLIKLFPAWFFPICRTCRYH
jgi:hypothetical protein